MAWWQLVFSRRRLCITQVCKLPATVTEDEVKAALEAAPAGAAVQVMSVTFMKATTAAAIKKATTTATPAAPATTPAAATPQPDANGTFAAKEETLSEQTEKAVDATVQKTEPAAAAADKVVAKADAAPPVAEAAEELPKKCALVRLVPLPLPPRADAAKDATTGDVAATANTEGAP